MKQLAREAVYVPTPGSLVVMWWLCISCSGETGNFDLEGQGQSPPPRHRRRQRQYPKAKTGLG